MSALLYADTRLFTGRHIVRGYLKECFSHRVVWTCPHAHVSRIHRGGKNGNHYAKKCAEAELRRRLRLLRAASGESK